MYINIILIFLIIWFLYSRFAGVKGLLTLTPNQFENELQSAPNKMLIDVRELSEVKQGKIPGAVNLPLSQLKSRTGEIPKDMPVYLYCRSGMRSKEAAKILLRNGFHDLSHLQGGIMAWKGKIAK